MRIAILGATGRVGSKLVDLVGQSDADQLSACYVSRESPRRGKPVDDLDVLFESTETAPSEPAELLVDFSTPGAVMTIIDNAEQFARALVVGTTGFTDAEMERIAFASESLPILLSANFAESFEPFVTACRQVAAAYPEHLPELIETYHARKKKTPSGTSLRMQREVAAARAAAGADVGQAMPIEVRREGDIVGRHLFRVEVDASVLQIGFEVLSLESYARGALQAGRWVSGQSPGFYSMADYIRSRHVENSRSQHGREVQQ
ncbi:MAG: hypothetical protein JJ992_05035 [Planctomycetes bacterium]|nr:hypothetical protein [Planctomycetota bacterium]